MGLGGFSKLGGARGKWGQGEKLLDPRRFHILRFRRSPERTGEMTTTGTSAAEKGGTPGGSNRGGTAARHWEGVTCS